LKFLAEQMTPSDMVSIMTLGATVQVVQDFTADRDRLTRVIKSFQIGQASELAIEADTGDPNSGEYTGAAFVADETEFNIFNTDRKLMGLESAVRMLAPLPEKKALVYFSAGIPKTGVENHSQLESTVNAAIRANVSFYPIDARGLVALAPGGDASKARPSPRRSRNSTTSRRRSSRWPKIPAARRCWIPTTSRWAYSRPTRT
jgi:VWFA-related protein